LVDNALDEMDRVGRPGEVTVSQDGEHTYTVTDQGRGFWASSIRPKSSLSDSPSRSRWSPPSNGASRPAAASAMVCA
jgi:hypothetical protein